MTFKNVDEASPLANVYKELTEERIQRCKIVMPQLTKMLKNYVSRICQVSSKRDKLLEDEVSRLESELRFQVVQQL